MPKEPEKSKKSPAKAAGGAEIAGSAKAAPCIPKSIRKRNGEQVPFDAGKIREAIRKACAAVPEEKIASKKLDELTAAVVAAIPGRRIPTVEQIQDLVEEARAELYREQARKLRLEAGN